MQNMTYRKKAAMAATAPMPMLAWMLDAEPVNADGEAVADGAVTLWEYETLPVPDAAGVELTPATVTVL